MEHLEHPLMREYHPEYEDLYIWRGLPGGVSKYEIYGFTILTLFVFVAQVIDGIRSIESYLGTFFILILLGGVYKGFQVGLGSIGYTRYEPPYITRMADDFLIWGEDPPIAITQNMEIRIREVDVSGSGVVYLYEDDSRDIVFLCKNNELLMIVAEILADKYNLKLGKMVNH